MSKYNTDLDYVILDIDISREELNEIKIEADMIISENKKKEKDEETKKILALAYLKKAQCRRKLESGFTYEVILYEDMGLGLFNKARKSIKKLLEKALELFPDMPEALMQLGLLYSGGYGAFKENENKSINFFNRAIQLKPDYAAAFNNRAMLFYERNPFEDKDEKDNIEKAKINFRNAVADLTEAIRIRPFDALYHLYRGEFHSRLKEHKEAAADFSSAINYASDVVKNRLNTVVLILNLRGKEYTELKEYGKAVEDFSETLRMRQSHDDTLLLRGKAYYLSGEKDKAKADIEEYLNRNRIVADENNRKEIIKIVGIKPEDIL